MHAQRVFEDPMSWQGFGGVYCVGDDSIVCSSAAVEMSVRMI